MPSFRTGTVIEELSARPGLQRVTIQFEPPSAPERAYVLTDLVGSVEPGHRVVVNTTAVELGLGTGGWHVIHWNLSRESWSQPGPGHIMKLRYTSLQADVGAAEEELEAGSMDSITRSLSEVPVVACGLHSQVGAVVAAIGYQRPKTRVAYVMTDGAALPLALSDLVADLNAKGLLVGTITVGHAFGGSLEAVSIPSALSLARQALDAEVIVVGMGPGVVGTGSTLGHTGIEVASILDSTAALGGQPVICVRASSADERARHRGMSHHTKAVLALVRTPLDVPVPAESDFLIPKPHRPVSVAGPDMSMILDHLKLVITTMGRDVAADPLFFAAAGAAATRALQLLDHSH